MQSFLHSKFLHNLHYKLHIKDNYSLLLAISCGQDSLCLLKLFADLKQHLKVSFAIIHIDHQWRQDATDNTKHIINMAHYLKFPLHLHQLNPKQYSEAEFRDMRYQIYIRIAQQYSYNAIATAHTGSDITETCLINMVKGCNIDSFNNLHWQRQINHKIKLIRPLLNFTRSEINWFCKYYRLPIWFDYTNIYYTCNRNRIRHELIPYLKQYYSTDIEKNINIFVTKTYYDTEYLRQTTVKVYLLIKHPYYVAFNYKKLLSQHKCMQIRVLNIFFKYNTKTQLNDILLHQILNELNKKKEIRKLYKKIQFNTFGDWAYII
uniref:tRNA(Ile)-lysidine synthase, chloroplastic n=1 Tax=Titanophycus setchellii TaxID=940129 RepID=A0A1G4NXY1_9FLOR|nr:tRNA Ile-lysidine synthetase [Titanophycus setchellii]SCW23540.1 tRNA Ile-lysidine synthetase [Titanophycus setchellii]